MPRNPLIEKEARIDRHRDRLRTFQGWLDDYRQAIDDAATLANWAYNGPKAVSLETVDNAIKIMEKEYQDLLKAAGEFLAKQDKVLP